MNLPDRDGPMHVPEPGGKPPGRGAWRQAGQQVWSPLAVRQFGNQPIELTTSGYRATKLHIAMFDLRAVTWAQSLVPETI